MDIKVLLGVQSGKGSLEKSTLYEVAAKNCNISPKYSNTTSQSLGNGGSFVSDGWISRAEVNGDIDVELTLESFKLLMESCGFKSTKKTRNLEFSVDEGGFTKYLTVIRNFIYDDLHETAKDCLVSSIKLNATLQAYVTANSSLIGTDFTTENGKLSVVPQVVDEGNLICLGTTIKENGTDITANVESLDITIDRKLEGKGALNSIYTTSIRPNGKGEVTLNLQFNTFDKTSYTNARTMLKNNTSYKVEVEFADTKDSTRKIKMVFPNVKISNVEVTNLEGSGGLTKNLVAYPAQGKEMPFEIVIENYSKA